MKSVSLKTNLFSVQQRAGGEFGGCAITLEKVNYAPDTPDVPQYEIIVQKFMIDETDDSKFRTVFGNGIESHIKCDNLALAKEAFALLEKIVRQSGYSDYTPID